MGVQSYPHTNVDLIAVRYLWLSGAKFRELDIYLLVGIIKPGNTRIQPNKCLWVLSFAFSAPTRDR